MAHAAGLALRVALLELLVQRADVVFDALNELRLVLADGAANVRPVEERVEAREDAEHLVGVARSSQLISQLDGNLSFNAINAFVVSVYSRSTQYSTEAALRRLVNSHTKVYSVFTSSRL